MRNNSQGQGRFSAWRKAETVLRLLRGDELDGLSQELGVTAATLSQWRDQFQAELRFLGITPSPAFVAEPEGNGCVERHGYRSPAAMRLDYAARVVA